MTEGVVVLQAPADAKLIVEKIEAESAEVVVTSVDVAGTPAGRAFRILQHISKEGDHHSVVRFTVRRKGGPTNTVPMEVYFHGDRN